MVRVVVAGCGRVSERFLTAAAKVGGLELVGFVDPVLAAAQTRRDQFATPDTPIGPALAPMLRDTSPDAVFDIAIPSARLGIVTTALRAGCHVLTEKPMAESMADAHDMLAVARATGRIHAVMQNRRYVTEVRRIARFLRSGGIGEVTSIYCDFFRGPHIGGFREEMDHVLLIDMAIHTFDVTRLFAGSDAATVHCREWNPKNSWFAHGASAIATFEMRNGVVASYRGSWCAEGLETSWESMWRIVGTRGSLVWDGADDIRAEVVTRPALVSETARVPIPPADPADGTGGHAGVISDFLAAIRGGEPPETAGEHNIRSLAMVFSAIESAERGRIVPVDVEAVPA